MASPEEPLQLPAQANSRKWFASRDRFSVRANREKRILTTVAIALGVAALGFGSAGIWVLAWGLGFAGGALKLWAEYRPDQSLRATLDDFKQLDHPDDRELCLVEIIVWDKHSQLGVDRGVAWFEEDRLCFSGRATSFEIDPSEVIPHPTGQPTVENTVLTVAAPRGSFHAQFNPLIGPHASSKASIAAFQGRLTSFASSPPDPTRLRQLKSFEQMPFDASTVQTATSKPRSEEQSWSFILNVPVENESKI